MAAATDTTRGRGAQGSIIGRTLGYGLLTVVLGGAYAGVVLGPSLPARRRYDATRTIQAFSGRLRQQVDLDTLTAELLSVVDQTMQPAWVSLWLRPGGRRGLEVRR